MAETIVKHLTDKIDALILEYVHENSRIMSVFYDNVTFLKTFEKLSVSEQMQAYKALKKTADNKKLQNSEVGAYLVADCFDKLDRINHQAGLVLNDVPHYPLSSDEHHIIRMDFYGKVDARPPHQLSDFYKNLMKYPLKSKLDISAYDFNDAPCWQLFRQFNSFRNIENNLKEYLWQNKINPDILKVMGVKDFSDLIFKTFQTDPDQLKVSFTSEDSLRNAFVKTFVRENEEEIARIMLEDNVDERYVRSLLNMMKRFGVTDVDRMVVTELYFTDQILDNFKQAGIAVDFKIGDKIPQELTDTLIDHNLGVLIQALDKKGNPLKKDRYPLFEVHHKYAITESNNFVSLARANYRENYLLVPSDLHRCVLHAYDKLTASGGKESYRRRLEFIEPNVAFMYGFSKSQQIVYDWRKHPQYQSTYVDDAHYRVQYDEVLAALNENRKQSKISKIKEYKASQIDFNVLKNKKVTKQIMSVISNKRKRFK